MFDSFFKDITKAVSEAMKASLTDFSCYPLVMGISEAALNTQLQRAFGSVGAMEFLPWNLKDRKDLWHLTVDRFAAPQVDFNTDVIDGCRLKMKVLQGSFKTWSVDMSSGAPKMVETPISFDDITIIVTTQVSAIRHQHWNPRDVQVQATFMDLEKVHGVHIDLSRNLEVAIGTPVKTGIAKVLAEQLQVNGKGHPLQNVFGSVDIPHIPGAGEWYEEFKPSAFTYSTTRVLGHGSRYQYGVLNVLLLIDGNKSFPSGGKAGLIPQALVQNGSSKLVISSGTILERYARPALERKWPGIQLKFDRGREGERPAKLSLVSTFTFGTTVNGRGRSAYLTVCDCFVKSGAIVLEGNYNTSAYGVFSDDKFSVNLSGWKVNPDLNTIDLPGETVWRCGRRYLTDHFCADAAYH